jgi:hypothetical protein
MSVSRATKRMLITGAVIFLLIILLFATASFWVNWWWFGSMGFRSLLVRRYVAESVVFLVAALFAGGIFMANVVIALRRSRRANPGGGRLSAFTDRKSRHDGRRGCSGGTASRSASRIRSSGVTRDSSFSRSPRSASSSIC